MVDDELSPRERAGVLAHVDGCRACRALYDELRIVDGLLLSSHKVDLSAAFTSATMAEIHAMPRPRRMARPLFAYAVCYLLAAWLLTAAALVLAPAGLRAALAALESLVQTGLDALAGVGHVAARVGARGEIGPWPLLVAAVVTVDAILALALVRGARSARLFRDRRYRW